VRAACNTALREDHRSLVLPLGENGLRLLALIFERPIVSVGLVKDELAVSFATASRLVGRFEDLGLLVEVTGQRRSRRFRYEPFLDLFRETAPLEPTPAQTTESAA
jgi:DNA-binding MarR family transcriptional regulator